MTNPNLCSTCTCIDLSSNCTPHSSILSTSSIENKNMQKHPSDTHIGPSPPPSSPRLEDRHLPRRAAPAQLSVRQPLHADARVRAGRAPEAAAVAARGRHRPHLRGGGPETRRRRASGQLPGGGPQIRSPIWVRGPDRPKVLRDSPGSLKAKDCFLQGQAFQKPGVLAIKNKRYIHVLLII